VREDADHHDPGDQAEQDDREQKAFFKGIDPTGFVGLLLHNVVLLAAFAERGP
jgi:hypothetical protein